VTTLPPAAARYVDEWLGEGWTAHPLAGDASVRAYYRIALPGGKTYMLAYYPEEVRPQLRRFLAAYEAVRRVMRASGAPQLESTPASLVPDVLHASDVAVLQHDVGDRTLYDVLHEDRDEGVRLYREAVDMLVAFQRADPGGLNAPFTAEFFYNELEMAREFYVEKLMGGDAAGLEPLMITMCQDVAQHPYLLCHRDYHGQNIHVVNDSLYLIDYQDLRLGPDTYDMASLLRDRGAAVILGDETELELLEQYRAAVGADEDIRRRYFETLLQRSIKILGTFSRQPIVRGRMHYLDFIPATLESIRRCLDELPRYAPIRDLFPIDFDLDRARERARELNERSS
jgi:aminoglycoside/choline kinase family phosphotransferase